MLRKFFQFKQLDLFVCHSIFVYKEGKSYYYAVVIKYITYQCYH